MAIINIYEATDFLKKLADRIDPCTGNIYTPDSNYDNIQLASALYITLDFVNEYLPKTARSKCKRKARISRAKRLRRLKTRLSNPENAGKAWGDEESKLLIERFDSDMSMAEIATLHQRTQTAIESRLLKIGVVSSRDEARKGTRHTKNI